MLEAGNKAPGFTLPILDGRAVSPEDGPGEKALFKVKPDANAAELPAGRY